MSDRNEMASAIIDAASSPKVAVAVAAGASATGAAAKLELITGWLSTISVGLGMCTAAVVLIIQILKLIRELKTPIKSEE